MEGMTRNVAIAILVASMATFATTAPAVQWMGNTALYENGSNYPARSFFLDPGQSLTITTQSWPIAPNQQVKAIVTTNNWQTSQEYVFTYDKQVGNNSQWYCILPAFPRNTTVNFYLRCDEWQNGTVYDSNAGANFGFITRSATHDTNPILQWFETDYKTIMQRLPEVVEAGYGAIYLPGPQKSGGGGLDIGYAPFDHFDLGDRVQKGSMKTRYGTTTELQNLIKVAHRLGIKVYCDIVLNHMANRASAGINTYPSLIPEDFHITSSTNTTNTEVNWNNDAALSFNMFNRDLLGLADLSQEDGNATGNPITLPPYAQFTGVGEPTFIRNNTVPQYYPGGTPTSETVGQYLRRWMVWLSTTIGFDGFRLDAVKHVPPTVFGFAPEQPMWSGATFTHGDIINVVRAAAPEAYFFGENYAGINSTTERYSQREYLKTGMNLIDFPLVFNLRDVLNSNGFGNLSAKLGNPYGVDTYGTPYQNGGFGPLQSVGFLQSHDDGPPTSNNLGYAFLLTRPGRPKVYYDGNNILPGNWSNFPRPGRADALGISNDVVPVLMNAQKRTARGYLVNRWMQPNDSDTSKLYVYERQVNGQGVGLIGLNLRGDASGAITELVQTNFPAGTTLEDLTGQMPNLTVGGDGKVSLTVPPNYSATEGNNGKGYVIYAPVAPKAVSGQRVITLSPVASRASSRPADFTLTTQTLPKGTYGNTKTLETYNVNSPTFAMSVKTDSSGAFAYAKFDAGVSPNGASLLTNTAEGLLDGYVPMEKTADGSFRLQNLSTAALADGLHVVRVRVFRNNGSGPGIFNEFLQFFYTPSSFTGVQAVDGVMTGAAIATQTRTFGSNLNRADGLYVTNDDQYLYVSIAGRVDPSESFTNGYMVWMDTDPGDGTGYTAGQQLKDDSGPAARLLSNRKVTFPSGFGAEAGIAMLRNQTLNAAPESPFGGNLTTPYTIGAATGAFRFGANPQLFTPIPALVAYQQRNTKSDPARGMEVAIKLTDLFTGPVPATPKVGFIAGLGTTGETGSTLTSSDPNFVNYGGRPLPNPYMTNQYLPTQSTVVGDPANNPSTLVSYAQFTLLKAVQPAPGDHELVISTVATSSRTTKFTVGATVVANTNLNGPVTLLVKPGSGISLSNKTGSGLVDSWQAIRLTTGSLNAGQSVRVNLQFTGNQLQFSPTWKVVTGPGVY